MKLISLQLNNFRQFYGQTPVIYFALGEKNTTIIHGNNGAGKTTILNAFTWILYEKFSPAFSSPEFLVNKKAINEVDVGRNIECSGVIVFDHGHVRYQVKRKCFVCKNQFSQIESNKSTLSMMVMGDDGSWKYPNEKPEDIIEKILPQSLHQYFFFDGEHIEHIFRSGERQKIAEDTKELIGVKLLERAINHLKTAKRSLNDELASLGDIEIKKMVKQQKHLEAEEIKQQEQNNLIFNRLDILAKEKKAVSERLLNMSSVKNLQSLKEKLTKDSQDFRHRLTDSHNHIKKLISSQGYLVFLPSAIALFEQIIDGLRQKGELPSGIKKEFVEQLLKQNRCICGNELLPNSQPYQEVEKWLNKAGIAEVEEAAIRLETQVKEIDSYSQEFWQKIDQYQININDYRQKISQIENEIDQINEQLRKYPDQNIQSTQKNLDNIEQHIRQLTLNQGEINLQIENINEQIKTIAKNIKKQEIKAEKYQLIIKRIKITEESIDCLEEVRQRLEHQFRLALEKRLQEIFDSISFTPYQPRLNQNYELNLIENTVGESFSVAASTGENQILSLSFIGAIIDMVKQWSKQNSLVGPEPSQFPIIMDSPFGSLDEIYRRQVARFIPQLANQLVVLVTKTQWRIEVETEMSNHINRQYILVYRSPKNDCQEDFINLGGKDYPLVKKSDNQFEYTEILEVDNLT